MITAATQNDVDVPGWVDAGMGLALAGMQAANDSGLPNPVDIVVAESFRLATLRGVKIVHASSLLLPEHISQAANGSEYRAEQSGPLCSRFTGVSTLWNSAARSHSHVELSAIDEVKAVLVQRMPLALAEHMAQAVVREVLATVTFKKGQNRRQRVTRLVGEALSLAA